MSEKLPILGPNIEKISKQFAETLDHEGIFDQLALYLGEVSKVGALQGLGLSIFSEERSRVLHASHFLNLVEARVFMSPASLAIIIIGEAHLELNEYLTNLNRGINSEVSFVNTRGRKMEEMTRLYLENTSPREQLRRSDLIITKIREDS